jgi:hypothetical protein
MTVPDARQRWSHFPILVRRRGKRCRALIVTEVHKQAFAVRVRRAVQRLHASLALQQT